MDARPRGQARWVTRKARRQARQLDTQGVRTGALEDTARDDPRHTSFVTHPSSFISPSAAPNCPRFLCKIALTIAPQPGIITPMSAQPRVRRSSRRFVIP